MKPTTPFLLASLFTLALTPKRAQAATSTWQGASTGWGTAANWVEGAPIFNNTRDIVFYNTGAANLGNNLGADRTIRTLTFNANADNAVTIYLAGNNSESTTTNVLTFQRSNSGLPGVITVDAGATGNHRIGNTIGSITLDTMSEMQIIHNGSGTLTIARPINETGGARPLVKSGTGTLILSGANTYSGATTVSAGTLAVNNNLSLQNSALITTGAGAVTLGVTTPTFGGLSGASGNLATIITSGYSSVTALMLNPNSGAVTYGGVIANGASGMTLTKTGAGTQTLTGTNTYSGTTTIGAGTLQIGNGGTSGSLSTSSAITGSAGATLAFNRSDTVTQGTHFNSSIGGSINVRQSGAGTLELTGTNTYSGTTTINSGTLAVNGSGSLNNSAVTVSGGTFRYNSSVAYTGTLTFTSGTLAGTNLGGSLGGQTIGSGRTLSPGNSPGTAATTSQTWAGGGSYVWEINNATGTAGADPGWDLETGTGTLTLTATSGSKFDILVTTLTLANIAGNAANFNSSGIYSWLIADFDSVTGFSADAFNINTTAFSNTYTGTFGVALGGTGSLGGDSSQIYLTYVPEPRAALLGGLGMLALLRRRRGQRFHERRMAQGGNW